MFCCSLWTKVLNIPPLKGFKGLSRSDSADFCIALPHAAQLGHFWRRLQSAAAAPSILVPVQSVARSIDKQSNAQIISNWIKSNLEDNPREAGDGSQKMRTSCGPLSTASGCLPVSDMQEWLVDSWSEIWRILRKPGSIMQHQHRRSSMKVANRCKSPINYDSNVEHAWRSVLQCSIKFFELALGSSALWRVSHTCLPAVTAPHSWHTALEAGSASTMALGRRVLLLCTHALLLSMFFYKDMITHLDCFRATSE